jgi:hypothetical protein
MNILEVRFNILKELFEKVLKVAFPYTDINTSPYTVQNTTISNKFDETKFNSIEFKFIRQNEQRILKKILIIRSMTYYKSYSEMFYYCVQKTNLIKKSHEKFDIQKFIDDLTEEPVKDSLMEEIISFLTDFDVIDIFHPYKLPSKERIDVHNITIKKLELVNEFRKMIYSDMKYTDMKYNYLFRLYQNGFKLKKFFSETNKNILTHLIQQISTDIVSYPHGLMYSNNNLVLDNMNNSIALINDIYETINEKYIKDDEYNDMIKIMPYMFYKSMRNLIIQPKLLELLTITTLNITDILNNYFMENVKTDTNIEYMKLYSNYYNLMLEHLRKVEEDKKIKN